MLSIIHRFQSNTKGSAVVEATILFPIIIMIFAGLVLLSMYLPQRAVLQHATQYAATALATERSDTWLRFDPESMRYYRLTDRDQLDNVYVLLFKAFTGGGETDDAAAIVKNMADKSIAYSSKNLTVEYAVNNKVVYKEISVTAIQDIPSPVNLSFVGFPKSIKLTVTSTAVVQNGDEFVRNIDLAADFVKYIDEKYHILSSEIFSSIKEVNGKIKGYLGI